MAEKKISIPKVLMDQSETHLECRVIGHQWKRFDDGDWAPVLSNILDIPRSFLCARCGMVKREVWRKWTGEMLFRTYLPPSGYRIVMEERDKTDYRTTRQVMRAALIEKEG